jgi:hypothetical protein
MVILLKELSPSSTIELVETPIEVEAARSHFTAKAS